MGTVYEIICWTTGLRYIGQTTENIRIRITKHKYKFNKGTLTCSSRLVLEHGNYEIYELEKVDDKTLLTEREFYYIQHTDCVNIFTGLSLNMELYRKEYMKEYRHSEKYKEANRERSRIYREKKKNLKNRQLLNTAVPSL